MNSTNDQLIKRFIDLSRQAYRCNAYTYTDFLTPDEQDQLYRHAAEYETSFAVSGGYEAAERQVCCFGGAAYMGYEPAWPVVVLEIAPLSERFGEALSHRDYLGALMSLGIERSTVGDILIKEKHAWLFCLEPMADYICGALTEIRHTPVRVSPVVGDVPELAPVLAEVQLNVASERLDAIVAAFINQSRTKAVELFALGRVFVNSRTIENGSKPLKEGDVLTVRGFGKAIYDGISHETKKGRYYVTLRKYM